MLRPALKPGHNPTRLADGSVLMGARIYGHLTELKDESGLVWPLCALLDGTRTVESLTQIMADEQGATGAQVREILNLFRECGWLSDSAAPIPASLTTELLDRHSRTLDFFANIDMSPRTNHYEILDRLRGASAVVIGVGGVGSAAAAGLVATGAGHVHCVDFDHVEISNLNRQLLYSGKDLGRLKVEAAAEHLRELDASVTITAANLEVRDLADAAKVIKGADVVFNCADTPAGIYSLVNAACYQAGIPWLMAGYSGAKYSLVTFIPGQTACHSCLRAGHLDVKREETYLPGGPALRAFHGVIAASAQIAGHAMALEGIYLLLGMPVQTAGRELHRHLTDYEHFYYLGAEPRPDCLVGCGSMLDPG
jgi:molybdopterin-synthase adenylyltransferase